MWEFDEYVNTKGVTGWFAHAQLSYENTYYMDNTYKMNNIWLIQGAWCISELEWNTDKDFIRLISTFLEYKGSWFFVQYFPLVKMQVLKTVIRIRTYKMRQNVE